MNNSTPIPDGYKRCSQCGKDFPASAEYFHRNKMGKYGLQAECKKCNHIRYTNPPVGKSTRGLSPEGKMLADKARFWSNINKPNEQGCMLWEGRIHNTGYGIFGVNSVQVLAHRFAWGLTHGPIPNGLFVCHTCDVRACCNPNHLFLGTSLDNIADMIKKERNSRGETRYNAKLTDNKVRTIRIDYASGDCTYQSLANTHGVTLSCIESVIQRKTWKHVR